MEVFVYVVISAPTTSLGQHRCLILVKSYVTHYSPDWGMVYESFIEKGSRSITEALTAHGFGNAVQVTSLNVSPKEYNRFRTMGVDMDCLNRVSSYSDLS